MCFKKGLSKSLQNQKNAYYQVLKNIDNMRFIVGKSTSFSPRIEFLPSLIKSRFFLL